MSFFDATMRAESGPASANRHLDDLKTPLHLLPKLRLPSAAQMDPECHLDDYEVPDSDNSSDEDNYASSDSEMPRSSATALAPGRATEGVGIVEDPVHFHGKTSIQGLVDATRKYRHMLLKQLGGPSVHVSMDQTPGGELLSHHRRSKYWRSPIVSVRCTNFDRYLICILPVGGNLGRQSLRQARFPCSYTCPISTPGTRTQSSFPFF
jgi:hypothetical protein